MRGSDGPPISLFAFQDIITTVSGVMILVVLFLILDVISHQTKELAKSPPSYVAEDLQKAKETKNKYQLIIAEEKKKFAENDKIISALRQQDLSSLVKNIRDEEALRKTLIEISSKNEGKINELHVPLKELNEIITTLPDKDKSIEKTSKETIAEARQKLINFEEQLVEEKKKFEKNKNKIAFTAAGGINKKLVLVECSGQTIRAQIQGQPEIFNFLSDKPTMDESIRKFLHFLDGKSPSEYFLVMLYKPSSVGYIMTMQYSVEGKKYDISKEPIQESAQGVYSE